MERSSTELTECYRILGLSPIASLDEIKSAYRRLVKQFHPDFNPGDRQAADRFIEINYAYETLLESDRTMPLAAEPLAAEPPSAEPAMPKVRVSRRASEPPPRATPLTPEQERIKQRSLELISGLLQQRQWQQAARHAEALASRLLGDREVGRLQAKAYHGWARALLDRQQYEAARPYLQKAMKADPENRSLWEELERDYLRIERGLRL